MNRLVLAGLGLKALPWEVTWLTALLKRCKKPCFPAIFHIFSGVFTPPRAIGVGREQQLPQRHFLQILQRCPRFIRGQASVVSLVGCGWETLIDDLHQVENVCNVCGVDGADAHPGFQTFTNNLTCSLACTYPTET
jgi:hypothetical protein